MRQYERMVERFDEWLDMPIIKADVPDFDEFVVAQQWGENNPRNDNPNPGNQTERLCLKAIRAYLRQELGLDNKHPLTEHSIPDQKGQRRKALTNAQRKEALKVAQARASTHDLALRNKAFMQVAWSTMARKFELSNIRLEHIDFERGTVRVWAKAKHRKGRREQLKKLLPFAIQAIMDYLPARERMANPDCPYLFVTEKGGQWKSESIGSFFKRLQPYVPFKIYAHAYRGGGATWASENGVPDRLIMKAGGWESHSVFAMYTEPVDVQAYGELLHDAA